MAINKYSQPLGQTLEQYIPLPFQEMAQAGQAIQQRGDLAEQQRDQVETGLSSMETMASGQTQFKNNFVNDYKKEGMELLKKYPNPSDPDFIRESRKLNMKYAADPRLQTIKQTNEFLKNQEKYKQEAAFKGVKVIDPNKNFTGVDSNGNLIVPKNSARGTNFDEDLTKSFLQIRDNMVDDGKGWKSNKQNLDQLAGNLVKNLETNPITRDAIDYYTQQGYSPEQARQATKGLIQQAYTDNLKTDRDYEYDRLQLARQEAAFNRMKASQQNLPPNLPFELLTFTKPILPGKEGTANKSSTRIIIDDFIKDLDDKGNLNTKTRRLPDTPENKALFGNKAKAVTRYIGEDRKLGINPIKELIVEGIDDSQVEMLNTARKVLGIKGGSAKEVFTRYNNLLSKFDNVSNAVKSTTNVKINDALAEVIRRQISSGEIYTVKNNKLSKVNFEDLDDNQINELGDIKTDNISGISPKNVGNLSGYSQFTDKKGNTYYTPLPEEYQRKFMGSKIIENYLQDFDSKNLKPININIKGNNKEVFINPNQEAIPYNYQKYSGVLQPYKTSENGNLVAGAVFQTKVNGKNVYLPLKMSDVENNELNSIYINIANNNKIEGN